MTEPTAAELHESALNHFSRGNGVEAARQLQWALIAKPDYAEAWHSRAIVLDALNDPFDAILCCHRAIELNEKVAAYWNTQGVCWAKLNQFASAVECYNAALECDPELAPAWHNKGTAARLSDNIQDAVIYYEKAVELRPDNFDYHLSYSAALLGAGRMAEGWHEYEYRFKVGDAFHRMMPLPEWDGSPDAAVVLYAEQGYGDTIMSLRFAPILRRLRNIKVYVEVKKPMLELAKFIIGIDGVIAYGDPLPADATHALPIMSTAKFCGVNSIDSIDGAKYLFVPEFPVRSHTQLPLSRTPSGYRRVGLCWASGIRPYQPELRQYAESKSIASHFLAPLLKLKGIEWYSLQMPSGELPFPMIDLTGELHDFYETAKLMMSLDLVVTVDTSVVHLAGALGIPTILLSMKDNCWRWLGNRSDSPWYNSVTQIRQAAPGYWPSVIERLCGILN